jgi:hypothetical protein
MSSLKQVSFVDFYIWLNMEIKFLYIILDLIKK